MIVRYLTKEDWAESCKVSSSAFIWKCNFEEEKKELDTNAEKGIAPKILGAFCDDNKTLMAQLEELDFESNFCGTYLKANGIGGVASRPEYRRGGAVRALFNELFLGAKQTGCVLSLLYPFSFDYYRKFGYERPAVFCDLTVPFRAISHIERNCDVELFEGGDVSRILSVYNDYAQRHTMMFRRSDDRWFYSKPFEQNEYTYIWLDKSGSPASYASFICDRPASTVHVKEIIYKNYESLRGILGFLRVYDGNYENLHFQKLPNDSPLMDMISEYKYCKTIVNNGGAVRILNMKALLEANKYPSQAGHFSLRYADDCVNPDSIFDVDYAAGKAEVTVRGSGEYDVSLNAPAAVRIILGGGINKDRLQYIGGIDVKTKADELLNAFPSRPLDYYEGF